MDQNFDLFGDPVPENWGGKGRPAHIPTLENYNKVKLLLAMGVQVKQVAKSLGVTQPTLRQHYSSLLSQRRDMRARMDAVRYLRLWQESMKGNVAALKEFDRILERIDVASLSDQIEGAQTKKPRQLGKKEAAQIAAETAGEGTDWGDDLQADGPTHH